MRVNKVPSLKAVPAALNLMAQSAHLDKLFHFELTFRLGPFWLSNETIWDQGNPESGKSSFLEKSPGSDRIAIATLSRGFYKFLSLR